MRRWVIFITDNHLVFLLLSITVFLISLFIMRDLNVEAFPDPSAPTIEIVAIYEGKSAEEVEKRITIPIEIGLAGMRNLERLNSISLYGLADIKCKFSYEIPYREARQEVINRLANISLPDGVRPNIIPSDMGEVMQYVIYGSNKQLGSPSGISPIEKIHWRICRVPFSFLPASLLYFSAFLYRWFDRRYLHADHRAGQIFAPFRGKVQILDNFPGRWVIG